MKTLFIIKPDAFERELDQKISSIIADNFNIVESGTVSFTCSDVASFYAHISDRPKVMKQLKDIMTSRPLSYLVAEGENVIARGRALIGATNPMEAEPHTIRGRFNEGTGVIARNLVHGSDGEESFNKEYGIIKRAKS